MGDRGADWTAELARAARRIGEFLYGAQVIAADIDCPAPEGEPVQVGYAFLRQDPGPYRMWLRRQGQDLYVRAPEDGGWWGPLAPGAYFRVLPGAGMRDPSTGGGGVTFRYAGAVAGAVRLEAFDRGGIWDDLPNMEAFHYEPQVAATFYADAYSAYVFAWMAQSGGGPAYREASALALDFVCRVYPQYQPMIMDALTHSDFKNPALIETVEECAARWAAPGDLARWRGLYPRMAPDEAYSPTNVYALRYHWRAARERWLPGACGDAGAARAALERVFGDQTADGLILDNNRSELSFGGYDDAHDLTYHLYSLACLARGYDHLPLPEVRECLLRGAAFSLALTTGGGEASYLGRGANNVYHLAAAIYAFLWAAGQDPEQAPRLRRAARLILAYLLSFQAPDGSFSTGLNPYPEERMGWNHCRTPYNALSAYFLIRALALHPQHTPPQPAEELLALEGTSRILFPAARYAAESNGRIYLVVFGGNPLSYPWSGVHKTGVAGMAALGFRNGVSLLPVLEQSLREGEWSTSDLPDIVGPGGETAVPAGPGAVHRAAGGIRVVLAYGGWVAEQVYRVADREVRLETTLTCRAPGRYRLVGAPGLSLRADAGWTHAVAGQQAESRGPAGGLILERLESTLPGGGWEIMPPSTTPRGWHRKVAWVTDGDFGAGEVHRYAARIRLLPL